MMLAELHEGEPPAVVQHDGDLASDQDPQYPGGPHASAASVKSFDITWSRSASMPASARLRSAGQVTVEDGAAVVDHGDALAQGRHVVHVVAGQDDRRTEVSVELGEERTDTELGDHVEADRRLVGEQQIRAVQQCEDQLAAHPLAEGQLPDRDVQDVLHLEALGEIAWRTGRNGAWGSRTSPGGSAASRTSRRPTRASTSGRTRPRSGRGSRTRAWTGDDRAPRPHRASDGAGRRAS